MSTTSLEYIAGEVDDFRGVGDDGYVILDVYARGLVLYSGPIEGPGSINRSRYPLDEGWALEERFDFCGHDGTNPHINYDLVNPDGNPVKKKTTKFFLKDEHHKDLF